MHNEDYNVLDLYTRSSIWLRLLYIVTPIAGELMDGCLFCEWIIQIDIVCVMLRSRHAILFLSEANSREPQSVLEACLMVLQVFLIVFEHECLFRK